MTKLEVALDALNVFAKDLDRATRRKRKIEREHIIAAVRIGTAIFSAVAAFVPQLKVVAGILNGINNSIPAVLPTNAGNGHQVNITS